MQDEATRRHDVILDAVGLAAERFLRSQRWQDAIADVLAALGNAAEGSRLQIYEINPGDGDEVLCSMRYEWVAPGIEPQIDNPHEQNFPLRAGGYGRWIDVLGKSEALTGLRDEFPESERQFLDDEGIRSVCVVPIFTEDEWWGWIGLDDCVTDRVWEAADIDALRTAAGLIGAAIERERADRRWRSAEAKYRSLVEHLPAITYIAQPEEPNASLYISPQLKEILGYEPSEWIKQGDLWTKLVHPDDGDRVRQQMLRHNKTGEPFTAEYRMKSRYGKQVWLHEEAVLVRDEAGKPMYWQGVLLDITEQKRAEEQFRETEAKYRSLIEQMPAVTYIQGLGDIVQSVTYMSPQIEGMLGFSVQEWMETPKLWESILHEDDRDRVIEEARRSDGTGEPFRVEYRVHAHDGRTVWVHDEALLVHDQDGKPLFWQGVMTDITERKRAEEQLREAEARYRTLVEQVPAITYVQEIESDRPGRLLYISPQVEQVVGYTPEEWTGDPTAWRGRIHPDDAEEMQRENDRAFSEDGVFRADYRMYSKDGRTVWLHDEARLVYDTSGKAMFWQGIVHDITEEKEAEQRLHEAEERYRTLVERIPAVTYVDPIEGLPQFAYVSPQVEPMLGYSVEDWRSTPEMWLNLVHEEDRKEVLGADDRARGTGEPFSIEYRMVAKDGHVVWVHDDAVLVRDANGKPLFWQGVIHDITERKAAEDLHMALQVERETSQRLRDLDDMKNTFLTAVSHDLRTPLAAILGLALTLEREDIDLAAMEARDLTHRISSNARKLDRLVTDLLDLDRLSRGILEPQRYPTDVGALVRKVVNEADFLGDHPVQVEAEPVVLSVDGAKVERIVENLLANAVRHTAVGTQVWVKVRSEDGGALIAVEDAGPGVLQELRDAVFEPFQQGLSAEQPSPGVGIGLSLVSRFAELHGGRAWVEEREGGGASFRVMLPASEAGESRFR